MSYPASEDDPQNVIMFEILQIVGAILILTAFAAAQFGWLDVNSVPYLVANVVGAAMLTVVALAGRDWGFLLLEGVWTAVSALSLVRVSRRREGPRARRPAHPA